MIVDAYASDPSVQNLPTNPPAPWSWQDGLLLYNSLVYVPHDDVVRLAFLQLHPDSPLVRHFGTAKTVELLSRNYYFPGMTAYVKAVPRVSEHGQSPFQSPAPVVIPGLRFEFFASWPPFRRISDILPVTVPVPTVLRNCPALPQLPFLFFPYIAYRPLELKGPRFMKREVL